ncbi:MAG: hypothetical protein ACRC8W_11230 [Plesiomonas shigelloides]
MTTTVTVNLNQTVEVLLTGHGYSILKEQHESLKLNCPKIGEFKEIEPNEDGLYPYKTQMWCLIKKFGNHIDWDLRPPFGTSINVHLWS